MQGRSHYWGLSNFWPSYPLLPSRISNSKGPYSKTFFHAKHSHPSNAHITLQWHPHKGSLNLEAKFCGQLLQWMNGWMNVSLDFIHVDENMLSFFWTTLYVYLKWERLRRREFGRAIAAPSSLLRLLFFSAFQRFPSFSRKPEMEPPLMTYHEAEMQRSHHFIQALKVWQ